MPDPQSQRTPAFAGETVVTGMRPGSEVKYLGNGTIGGPAILFTGPDDPDLTGDYFDAETDLWLDDDGRKTLNVLFDHGLDSDIGSLKVARGPLEKRDREAWMQAKLNESDDYIKDVLALAEKGVLGWSTGSASHLVRREKVGKSWRLTQWPVIEVSLTHRPAEPRTFATPLKSWAATRKPAGKSLDYDDSWRDSMAAEAAVTSLSNALIACIGRCFGLWDASETMPAPEARLAMMRAEFDDFTEDSMAIIAALLSTSETDEEMVAKSVLSFLSQSGRAASAVPFRDMPPQVVSAVKGFRDLSRQFAEGRAAEGRSLGAVKRDAIRLLIDGVSPAIDDLRALIGTPEPEAKAAPANDVETNKNRLRLLALANRASRVG